jgi:hypothetical protein
LAQAYFVRSVCYIFTTVAVTLTEISCSTKWLSRPHHASTGLKRQGEQRCEEAELSDHIRFGAEKLIGNRQWMPMCVCRLPASIAES